jgi:hypothetical protein
MSAETDQYDDEQYVKWVKRLDECDKDFDEWEANFIAGNTTTRSFSERQREKVLDMVAKYL